MKKRILPRLLLLSPFALVFLLASCGGGDKPAASSIVPPAVSSSEATSSQASSAEESSVEISSEPVIVRYTVTFVTDSETLIPTQKVREGWTAAEPDDPEKEEYNFVGWFLAEATETFDFETPITADVTLYAHWEPKKIDPMSYFTIDYYPDRGGFVVNDYRGKESTIQIPEEYEDSTGVKAPIVGIGKRAFYGRDLITRIELSKNVAFIDGEAFTGTSLEELYVTASLHEVDKTAFDDCPYVFYKENGITFLPSLESQHCLLYAYSSSALSFPTDCEAVLAQTPDNVQISGELDLSKCTYLPNAAFKGQKGITKVTLGEGLTELGPSAFEGCSALAEVAGGPKSIAVNERTFASCSALTKIEPLLAKVEGQAFLNNLLLNEFDFDPEIDKIASSAFESCIAIQTLKIPAKVTFIGENAFKGCVNLASLAYDAIDCVNAGSEAKPVFEGCASLATLTLGEGVTSLPDRLFATLPIAELKLPASLEKIGNRCFAENEALASIDFAEGLTLIGNEAFLDCPLLEELAFPASLIEVRDRAFEGCVKVATISLPSSLKTIGASAFAALPSLTDLIIPENVTAIGENAFASCENLKSVHWNAKKVTIAGSEQKPIFASCDKLDTVAFGETAQALPAYAFAGLSALEEVTIPSSITELEDHVFASSALTTVNWEATNITSFGKQGISAFMGASSLTTFAFSDEITEIPAFFLNGFSSIENLVFGENSKLVTIGQDAFNGCSGLVSLTLPSLVKTIDNSAFKDCSSLVTLPYGTKIETIGDSAFEGCAKLTSLPLPSSLKTIGASAFKGCAAVASLTLPESLTSIGDWAFMGLSAVESLEIPSSVQTIGTGALSGWKSLATLNLAYAGRSKAEENLTSQSLLGYIFGNEDYDGSYHVWQSYDEEGHGGSFYLPATLKTLTVREKLYPGSLHGASALENVTILCKDIPALQMEGNTKLKNLTLSNELESIGASAFASCSSLTSISFPASLKTIGAKAFRGSGLTALTIPSTIETIGDEAFRECASLASASFSADITVGKNVFTDCSSLTSMTGTGSVVKAIPVSVTEFHYLGGSFASDTFYGGACGIKTLYVGKDVTEIPYRGFRGATSLESIVFEEGGTENLFIAESAFYGTGLKSLTILNRVNKIGSTAFAACSLTEITTGTVAIELGNSVFSNCGALATVNWNYESATCYTQQFGLFDASPFANCPSLKSIVFGASVKEVPNCIARGVTSLTGITLSEGVVSIFSQAFQGCTGLTTVTLPESLLNIYEYAFKGCTGLEALPASATLQTIAKEAFAGCTGFKSVTLPSSMKTLGDLAFQNCTGITSISVSGDIANFGSAPFDGCLDIADFTFDCKAVPSMYIEMKTGATVLFTNNVESIGRVFTNWSAASSLTFPSSLKTIGDYAFANMTSWTDLSAFPNLVNIGNYAFQGCTGLVSLTLPSTLKTIGEWAFKGCTGLTDIVLPAGMESIGYSAFEGCKNLTTMTLPFVGCELNPEYGSEQGHFARIFGNNSTTGSSQITQAYSTSKGKGSTYYVLPNNLTSVTILGGEVGYSAFQNCAKLNTILFPNSVSSIGDQAFRGCSAVISLVFGEGLTSVGSYAFIDCTALKELVFPAMSTGFDSLALSVDNIVGAKTPTFDTLVIPYLPSNYTYTTPIKAKSLTIYSGTIPANAFKDDSTLKTLILGDDVTSIGDQAFRAASLESVTLGKGITAIPDYAFYYCSSLTTLDLTKATSLESIGTYAFYRSGLTSFVAPASLKSIASEAFATSYSLESIDLGSIETLGTYAFYQCNSLASADLGDTTITALPSYVFSYSKLSSLTLPATCKSISSYAFDYAALGDFDLSASAIETIADYAFRYTTLTSLTLPNTLTSIGKGFLLNSSLTSITIPSSVTDFGSSPFNSSHVTTVYWNVNDGFHYDPSESILAYSPVTTLIIKEGVTEIPASAFAGCSTLAKIYDDETKVGLKLPSSVIYIRDYAFDGCSIAAVEIGKDVRLIGTRAFGDASVTFDPENPYYYTEDGVSFGEGGALLISYPSSKESVSYTIPNTVTHFAEGAFQPNTYLETLVIPSSVASLPAGMLSGYSSLRSLTVPYLGASAESASPLGYLFGTTSYSGSYKAGTYYIPSTLTTVTVLGGEIPASAFAKCTSLTGVTLPDGLTAIPSYCFQGCTGLSAVSFPASVASIGESAYSGCTGLTELDLPATITSVADYAFANCTGLETVTVIPGITSFSEVFDNCSIVTVNFSDAFTKIPDDYLMYSLGNTTIKTINLPSGLTEIGHRAFYRLRGITSMVIPESVTRIGYLAFNGCTGLESVTLPSGLTLIEEGVFQGCTHLTDIEIPAAVTQIDQYAFNCNGMSVARTIYIPATVTKIGKYTFDKNNAGTVVINCEASSKPSGWDKNWNSGCTVNWGVAP